NPRVSAPTRERALALWRNASLGSLPEAEREVHALRSLYGGERSTVYIGEQAREERVKKEAADYEVLHFASHAVLSDGNPLYSHLVLAGEEAEAGEDGLLEAWEIMKLRLKAELVVLSACETARGRISAGEGVIGMSWAFFVAGTPTTVVSQWKVPSA